MQLMKSFREYVEKLEACGEIVPVTKEVDWNLEMSAITRHAYDLPSAAPLFKNIKDCTPGFEVLGAPVGLSPDKEHPFKRVALSLGLPIDTSAPGIVKAWSELADVTPIPPREVETGACKENKLFGKDVDLTKLPVPLIHYGDGGRYINTYGIFIARTPDGSWVNWAISRAMLDGPQTIAGRDSDAGLWQDLCRVEEDRQGDAFRPVSGRRSGHRHDRGLPPSFPYQRRRGDRRLVWRASGCSKV